MSVSSSPGEAASAAQPLSGPVELAPGVTVKIRSPIVVAILGLITLGIYVVFWWYYVNKEMAEYGRSRNTNELGDSPGKSTLALFPGALIVVPALWTTVTTFQRIQAAQRLTSRTPINGWLGLVLYLVIVPAYWGYMQSGLNSAWRAAAESAVEPTA
ncbi:MAG TPA: DUF4234 domain-containing protein [Gaiellaceae bacterium]|jgi:hypothetical protein|nr:DUF4234 domain-containing protein [Gaiellaceae bacterium]